MQQRPVLYLDLDDTVISWAGGRPSGAAGVRDFLSWALDAFEVRWLTRWARDGRMDPGLLGDLAKMSGIPTERLRHIEGLDWGETDCKLNGIAWMEHTVLGRPFVWVEDEMIGARAAAFLEHHGFAEAHHCCNVTKDAEALQRIHRRLMSAYSGNGGGGSNGGGAAE